MLFIAMEYRGISKIPSKTMKSAKSVHLKIDPITLIKDVVELQSVASKRW